MASYRASLPPEGDRERGREIFRKQCVACHRVEGEGRETGPALAAVQARGAEAARLAGGGVDHVVEVGGIGTLAQSMAAVGFGGGAYGQAVFYRGAGPAAGDTLLRHGPGPDA